MSATTVSNSPTSSNPDYPVKVTSTASGQVQHVNVDNIAGLSIPAYDYVAVSYPSAVQEIYTFKTGGVSGTVVSTVTVNYTDATKNNLSSAAKT